MHIKRIPHASKSVIDDDGNLTQTYKEERVAFRQHFCSLMKGTVQPLADIISSDRSDHTYRYDNIDFDKCWKSIPSPTRVINMSLNANMYKAPGENLIVGNVHRKFANEVGMLMFPLVLKTFVRIQPSITWRGGMVHEIYKNKGPRYLRPNFRDVLLANDSGKHVAKEIRKSLLPRAKKLIHASQYGGGFNGGETAFANMTIRCASDLCKGMGLSFSVLYADVVSAFARMLRRAVFDVSEGDEIWIAQLRNAGFSDSDIHAIRDMVAFLAQWNVDADGNITSGQDGGTNLCFNVARQWYKNTWVSQEGINHVIKTDIGCMAGTPLADLLFTVVVSRVLHVVRKSISLDGLESFVMLDGKRHDFHDASFVDDCAQPVTAPAADLTCKTTCIASIMYRVFACFQLELNFLPGKSECTALFAGPGKKAALRTLTKLGNVTRIECIDGSVKVLRWVQSYKHVGTRSDIGEELSARCAVMRSAFASMRRHIFRNPSIVIRNKLIILQVYIMTKGTFQCSVWPEMSTSLMKRFSACIMSMYREVTGNTYDKSNLKPMLSDIDMLYEHNLISPTTILRFARLSLLCRLCVKAPEFLFSMIEAIAQFKGSWTSTVLGDLRWLAVSSHFCGCMTFTLAQWCERISDNPKCFRRHLNEFVLLRIANIPDTSDKSAAACLATPTFHCCDVCSSDDTKFTTFQRLCLHMFKKHGYKNIWRRYVYMHTHCPVCLKRFWSRERLINHLRYRSKICRYNIQMRGFQCTEEQACEIDLLELENHSRLQKCGKRRHAAKEPVIRLHGPLLQVILPDTVRASTHHALGYGHNHF